MATWSPPEVEAETWTPPEAQRDWSPPEVSEPRKPNSALLAIGKFLGNVQDIGKEAFSGILPPEIMQPVFGGSEASLRSDERSKPIIAPSVATELVGQLPAWAGGNEPIVRGATDSLVQAVSEFSKPSAIAQVPAFFVPGVAETYAANILADQPEQFSKLREIIQSHGVASKEAGAAAAALGIQDLMGLLALKGGALGREIAKSRVEPPIAEPVRPASEPVQSILPKSSEAVPALTGEAIEQAPMSDVIAPEQLSLVAAEGQPGAVPVEAARAETPKTRMDLILDKVEKSGEVTITIEGPKPTRENVEKVQAAAAARGMTAAFDGRNYLIRKNPAMTVPDLKSTEEAVAHGESGAADVPALNAKRDALLNQAETATGDDKVALITQAQLYREAAETATKSPKLLPGEKQGDLISSTQPEDFALVGEKGVDTKAADEAAAARAEEAKLKQEHEQGLLSDFQEHQTRGGDELLDAIQSGGGLPAKSSPRSDVLSGELKNIREEVVSESGKQKYGFDYNKIFTKDAPGLDTLTQYLRAKGFDVETPNDTLSLIQERLRSGKEIYGNEVKGTTADYERSAQALGVAHPLPAFLKSGIDYFTKNTPSQIWNSVKGSVNATLGKTFARTTIADRQSGELAARWISSRIAAPHLAETFSANVLEGTGVDPIKFGAALTEDNLRSIRKTAENEGRPEDAAKVTTIIGAKNSPFKTEAEYKAFLADSGTQTAIERHRALWAETIDPMFRQAQNLEPDEPLPSRGDETGARINLYNDIEGKGKNVVSGTGTGNLTATMRKKSPFAIKATGTGQSYNVDYNSIMANTFGRQLEIANKNAFEKQLVESGNAIIGKPAKDVTLPDGEATVAFPLKRTVVIDTAGGGKIPVNQNIFVRKSLAGEYRRGSDVDILKVPALVRGFNAAINRAALAGLTDASVHVLNLSTALLTRPSIVGGVLTDSLLSVTGRADVPFTVIKAITKGMKDNRVQLAELAEIGALKGEQRGGNPLGKVIAWADRTTRLVLDDAFKNMADAGLVERTETNRREFINQVGQYNKKAQGDLRRLARDSGFGPFATAGTSFNTLGLRTLTGSPGIPATSTMAAASLRANVMSKWVGATVVVGMLNYLLTKDKGGGVTGRPGVPLGKVDTGLNDENGRPLSIPVFDILGLGRALRVSGARGLIESQRKGLSLQNGLDSAATDIWNTNISPFAGPVIRFAGVASSGKQLPAINVPRTSHVVPPGESQAQENLKQAIIDANPVLKSLYLATEPGQGTRAAILQQVPRLTLQPSQSADFMAKYPEIVRKAQAREYLSDVIGRARKMNPEDQIKFVRESLLRLAPEDQEHAKRTLKYSHVRY